MRRVIIIHLTMFQIAAVSAQPLRLMVLQWLRDDCLEHEWGDGTDFDLNENVDTDGMYEFADS